MPSIHMNRSMYYHEPFSFKPCYKWNAFNTLGDGVMKILLYGKF